MLVFNSKGELKFSSNVLTGVSKEDKGPRDLSKLGLTQDELQKTDMVTPTGAYYAKIEKISKGYIEDNGKFIEGEQHIQYGDSVLKLKKEGANSIAVHRTPVKKLEERAWRFNKDSETKRISHGCVNMEWNDYRKLNKELADAKTENALVIVASAK